ncbi:MAG: guanylate kinase [Flavobacteriales bacterium]|jgi:guanylate kinase|nr:guanylate kinase [Flavobacteriales bacterium]|tara:strand:- start:516 stop:1091 length:576 start_codon:yes stop_codon:yes gene_type:complete
MKKEGKIIVVCGISGSGKTTLVNYLLSKNDLNLAFSISACSRLKRAMEKEGEQYIFLSLNEFKKKIKMNAFLEWEEVYPNHFYGTLKSSTQALLDGGKHILFDVDVKGALSIKEYFRDQACTIFIKAPSIEVVKKRLIARKTESNQNLILRIEKMEEEMMLSDKMDYELVNDDLAVAKYDIYNYVKSFLVS